LLTDFISHDLSQPLEVCPEEQWVQLDHFVPQLEEIFIGYGSGVRKIDNHGSMSSDSEDRKDAYETSNFDPIIVVLRVFDA